MFIQSFIVNGEVYSCGLGEQGQLGIGMITFKEYQPFKVRFEELKNKDNLKLFDQVK